MILDFLPEIQYQGASGKFSGSNALSKAASIWTYQHTTVKSNIAHIHIIFGFTWMRYSAFDDMQPRNKDAQYIRTYMHTDKHTYKFTYTYIHAYMHTCIHTHTVIWWGSRRSSLHYITHATVTSLKSINQHFVEHTFRLCTWLLWILGRNNSFKSFLNCKKSPYCSLLSIFIWLLRTIFQLRSYTNNDRLCTHVCT